MSRNVHVEEEAEAELLAAADWYEREGPGLGAALGVEVQAALHALEREDVSGSPVPGVSTRLGIRRVILARFPYAIVFVDRGPDRFVIAFAHHRRRPGFWRTRIRR